MWWLGSRMLAWKMCSCLQTWRQKPQTSRWGASTLITTSLLSLQWATLQRRLGRMGTIAALLATDGGQGLISEAELVIAPGRRMTPSNLIYLIDYTSLWPQGKKTEMPYAVRNLAICPVSLCNHVLILRGELIWKDTQTYEHQQWVAHHDIPPLL